MFKQQIAMVTVRNSNNHNDHPPLSAIGRLLINQNLDSDVATVVVIARKSAAVDAFIGDITDRTAVHHNANDDDHHDNDDE
jgi:hypothetical protein